ncbi:MULTISPECIES: hypothetical protein, partial [unclassified Mesorhizobium]|uniref:hypothetical protein n=1 Tax=unclassified Mesorhizobium TaxID=325217 RepID=UPI001FDFD705
CSFSDLQSESNEITGAAARFIGVTSCYRYLFLENRGIFRRPAAVTKSVCWRKRALNRIEITSNEAALA